MDHVREFVILVPGMPKLADAHPQQRDFLEVLRPQGIIDDLIAAHALDEATMCLKHWLKRKHWLAPIKKRRRKVPNCQGHNVAVAAS